MKSLVNIVAAVVMASALMSGYINVNFQHNLHLPKELTNKSTILESKTSLVQKQYDIYLVDVFNSKFALRDVIILLDTANKGDVIKFHIAGDGGVVDTTLLLINKIRTTKAKTVMLVEAPSYSGHAMVAISGNELWFLPYTYLMFHTSSGFGYDCSKEEGRDRGQTNKETCEGFLTMHLINLNAFFMDNRFLTAQQKTDIIMGKTVYMRMN